MRAISFAPLALIFAISSTLTGEGGPDVPSFHQRRSSVLVDKGSAARMKDSRTLSSERLGRLSPSQRAGAYALPSGFSFRRGTHRHSGNASSGTPERH